MKTDEQKKADRILSAKKHNLKVKLVNSVFNNDKIGVMNAADEIFESGFELEEIGMSDGFYKLCASAIIKTGWVPKTQGL
jgi:hypothetical protein